MAHAVISSVCIALMLGQALAPALAHGDGNPFSNIPGPVVHTPQPTAPAPDPQESTDDANTCVAPDPSDNPLLTPFQRSVEDYIQARASNDPRSMHYLNQVAVQVFENPGSKEYVEDLKYIDSQATRSPDAMYDLAVALQNRWEAAYGMELDERVKAGTEDPSKGEPESAGERRNDRTRIGGDTGAMIGTVLALAALGLACVRHPTAIARYNAVFRALLPAVGFTGGAYIGHQVAQGLNNAGVFETQIPVAPAHVMKLGIERDDFTRDDHTLVRTLVPVILGVSAADATFAAVEGETLATTLLGAIRAVRVANAAATPAKLNPVGLVASIAVSIVVEHLAESGIEAWELHSLKKQMMKTSQVVTYAESFSDPIALYRGADALVQTTLNFSAFVNKPVYDANNEFKAGLARASQRYAPDSPELSREIDRLAQHLSEQVREATDDMDQQADADYDAYLALAALEHQDAGALDSLPDLARNRAAAYIDAFRGYRQGFDAYINSIEQSQLVSLSPQTRADAYNDFFQEYIGHMKAAKDKQLASDLQAGKIPKHAGHALLEASALLRETGSEYVRPQADFLMAEVARNENLIRAALSPALRPSQEAEMAQGSEAPWDGRD